MSAPIFTPEEQKELDRQKVQLKIDNEKYLRTHPEVNIVLSRLTQEILAHKPEPGALPSFVHSFFTENDLAELVAQHHQTQYQLRQWAQQLPTQADPPATDVEFHLPK